MYHYDYATKAVKGQACPVYPAGGFLILINDQIL